MFPNSLGSFTVVLSNASRPQGDVLENHGWWNPQLCSLPVASVVVNVFVLLMGTRSPGNGTGSASPHTGDSPDRYPGLRRALCSRAQPDQPIVMKITETAILTHISGPLVGGQGHATGP